MDKGFEILDGVLTEAECRQFLASLKSTPNSEKRAGQRHLMGNDNVRVLAHDQRLLAIARRFVGSDAVPYRATLFDKSDRVNWLVGRHQDTALPLAKRFESGEWGPWSVKKGIQYSHAPSWALQQIIALRICLDESGEDNGPLKIIPGSHLHGVLDDSEVLEIAHRV
jgi:ectoine hydroxylase-related dioxygenase (phytanoyl-CoA dioxygenase family)